MKLLEVIRLKEVLQRLDTSAEPFSISYVKLDRRKKKGGEIVRFEKCLATRSRAKGTRSDKIRIIKIQPSPEPKATKKPNHFANATRNVQVLPSFVIRKLHIWLILEFNGMKVIL